MATLLATRSSSRFLQVSSASIIGRANMNEDSETMEKIRIRELRRTLLPGDPGVKPFSDIPGPPSLPILGTLWKYYLGEYKLDRPQETYSMFLAKYGPLVKENLFCGNRIVHIFDPNDLREAYTVELGLHSKRESHGALRKYRLSRKDFYGHPGVSCSNGEEWAKYRYDTMKVEVPYYRGRPYIPFYWIPAIKSIADDFVQYMKSNLNHNGEISLLPALNYYTLECMGAVMFGRRLGCFDQDRGNYFDRLIEAVHESHCAILRTDLFPPILVRKDYKNLEIAQDFITDFVFKGILNITDLMALGSIRNTDPFNESEKGAFVIDEDKNSPVRISDSLVYTWLRYGIPPSLILPMAADFFQGGIQTPAHTLSFILYHLARNPDKQQILREKLNSNRSEGEKYLSNVIAESFRLNPPTIGTGRTLYIDLVLSGYHVPKGTHVIYHHDIATKLESNYPEPLKFIPERSGIGYLDNYVFKPFIGGSRRVCLGIFIALKEFEEVLKKIIPQFEISYHHKKVGVRNFLINEPDPPIKLRLKEL